MSDEELVELIRSAPWSDGFPYLKETADRIEELEAKLRWVIGERDATFARMLGRAEAAEAKLAKAVDAIEKMRVSSDAMMLHVARTTLGELTKRLK